MLLRYEYQRRGLLDDSKPSSRASQREGSPSSSDSSTSKARGSTESATTAIPSKPLPSPKRKDFDPTFVKADKPPPIPPRPKNSLKNVKEGKFVETQFEGSWKLAVVQQVGEGYQRFKLVLCESDAPHVSDAGHIRLPEKQPAFPLLSDVLAQRKSDKQFFRAKALKVLRVNGEYQYLVMFDDDQSRQLTAEKLLRPVYGRVVLSGRGAIIFDTALAGSSSV